MDIIPHKHCSKCGADKPLTEYHQDKHKASGYVSACKLCRNAHRKAIYDASDYDRTRRVASYWRQPDRERAASQAYRSRHREAVRATGRAWYHANRARAKQTHRLWVVQNRHKRRSTARLYFARKRGNGGSFSAAEWEQLKLHCNYACLCCGRKEPEITLTADHVVPVSKGGSSYIDNIQPLCVACNSGKCDRTIDYRT